LHFFCIAFNGFVALEVAIQNKAHRPPEQSFLVPVNLMSATVSYFITTGHNTFIFKKNQTLRIYINFLLGGKKNIIASL
jgi:hypothetical protein